MDVWDTGDGKDGRNLSTGLVFSKENGSWGREAIHRVVGRGSVLPAEKLPPDPGASRLPRPPCELPGCPPHGGLGPASVYGKGLSFRIEETLKTVGEQS